MKPKKFRESCGIDIPEWNSIIEKMLKEYAEQQVKLCNLHDVSGMLPSFKELILQMNLRLKTDRSKMIPVDYGFGWQDCMKYLGFKHKRR